MRTLLLLLLPVAASAAIDWTPLPFDAALQKAAAEKKPILVDVFAEWCGPCHEMDKVVFSRADVAKALADVVPMRIDAETDAGKALVARYHVVGYPTVLLIGPDGQEIDRILGFVDGDAFIRTVGEYREGKGTFADLERQLSGTPDDLELLAKVAQRAAIRGLKDRAELLADKVYAADPDDAKGLASQTLYTVGRYLYLRGAKDYDKAIANFTRLRAKHPQSKFAGRALMGLATAFFKKGEPKKTRALLDGYLSASPEKSGTYNAVAWFSFKETFDPAYGLATAEKGLKVNPQDAGLLDTYAELLFQQGRAADALAAIDRAIAADPKEPYYRRQRQKFADAKSK